MPLFYAGQGAVQEHVHTRNAVSIFDVSHMVQSQLKGKGATRFLSYLTPSAVSSLKPFFSTLSVLLNERGGIIDDLMITRHDEDDFYLVTNASRKDADLTWIQDELRKWNKSHNSSIALDEITDKALLAIQGPSAAQLATNFTQADLTKLYFGQSIFTKVSGGVTAHIARSGYTGEDGFEISLPAKEAINFTKELLNQSQNGTQAKLAGLAARDSLRIEAGLCLYGSDISEKDTPVEAGLSWLVAKDKRSANSEGGEASDFIGCDLVRRQLAKGGGGPSKRRVGLIVEGAPARHGAIIYDADGKTQIGQVTSGIPSPTLGKNIAMGYVASGHHKTDTRVQVQVRNKMRDAQVCKMPFVPAKYYRAT